MTEAQWQLDANTDIQKSQAPLLFVGLLALICASIFGIMAASVSLNLNQPLIYAATISTLFVFALHILCKSIVLGGFTFIGLDFFFITGFVLYNLMLTISMMIGDFPFEAMGMLPSLQYVTKAALLSAACGNAFIAGFIFRGGPLYKKFMAPLPARSMASAIWVGQIGFAVLVLGLLFRLIYIFLIVGVSAHFGHRLITTTITESTGGRLYGIATILIRLGVAATAVGYALSKGKLAPKVFWPVLIVVLLLLMVEGERGTIFAVSLSLLIARHLLIKRIKIIVLVGGCVALFMLFGAIRVARQMPERSLTGLWRALTERHEETGTRATFMETAGSFTTISRTMARVPELEGYKYGMTIVPGITSCVPGLSGVGAVLFGKLGFNEALYASPASWLTWREAGGEVPTSGLGFSNVADGYLNWGMAGAPFMFLAVGALLRTVESKIFRAPNLMRVLLFVILCDEVLYWARSSMDGFFRPLVWGAVIVWIASSFSGARQMAPDDEPEMQQQLPA